mmetsp:Transcript_11891/g.23691  ORF Transcript_11891/g.23691 Transcript_11891/m.23691 type:complete len:245 (-) Transcript_11891:262-996(-)
MARHFGTFDPLIPKRNFIGGLVSNENPPDYASGESHSVPGLLYGVCESIAPLPQIQDKPLCPQGYRFGWHGGHHQHDDGNEGEQEEERLRQLLSASISRETATQYSTCHKEALVHLLMIFSKVNSVRELASMKSINSDIWWYILSMMNGTDLTADNEEEEDKEEEWKHDEEEAGRSSDSFVDKEDEDKDMEEILESQRLYFNRRTQTRYDQSWRDLIDKEVDNIFLKLILMATEKLTTKSFSRR